MTAKAVNSMTWAQGWLAYRRPNPSSKPIADYLAAHRARMKAGPKLKITLDGLSK